MATSKSRRRRIGLAAAVVVPVFILFNGLCRVDAQFPGDGYKKPGGFSPSMPDGNFKPPGGSIYGGALGNSGIVYDWTCSKCGALVTTTNTPGRPAISHCFACGARFAGGGMSSYYPPSGFKSPGADPWSYQPPVNPPSTFQPPASTEPPANPPAIVELPANPPADQQPPKTSPEAVSSSAPPAPSVALPVQTAPVNRCGVCCAAIAADSSYCGDCTLKLAVVAGGLGFGVIAVLFSRIRGSAKSLRVATNR